MKNYIGIKNIHEGKMIPREMQLVITGSNLGKSSPNEYVSNVITKIMEEKVLRAERYDSTEVIKPVKYMQNGDHTRWPEWYYSIYIYNYVIHKYLKPITILYSSFIIIVITIKIYH